MARRTALLSAALAAAASAQDLCSCSPTAFEFTLDLSGTCDDNTINGNPGIIGSFCFLETVEEAVLTAEETAEDDGKAAPDAMYHEMDWDDIPDDARAAYAALGYDEAYWNGEGEDPPASMMSWMELTAEEQEAAAVLGYDEASWDGASIEQAQADVATTAAPETTEAPEIEQAQADVETTAAATRPPLVTRPPPGGAAEEGTTTPTLTTEAVRLLQDAPGQVVEVISVQFLEFDNSGDLTVINQDDTYVDVSLSDGDSIKFYSASSMLDTSLPLEDQQSTPALVPGGASLIIYGRTADGGVVRNRFFWLYDMNCGDENSPVDVGDQIAWATVSDTSNAWPAFCPALPEGSPTISPRTNEPTLTPSKAPVLSDFTDAPVADVSTDDHSGGWGADVQGPAFHESKAGKAGASHSGPHYPEGKAGKAKSGKAKSSKHAKTYDEVAWKGNKSGKSSKGHHYNVFRDSSFLAQRANGASSTRSYGLVALVSCLWIAMRQ